MEESCTSLTVTESEKMSTSSGGNIIGRLVITTRSFLYKGVASNAKIFKWLLTLAGVIVFHVYLAAAVRLSLSSASGLINWCDGVGFLIILVGITYWSLFYYFILKRVLGRKVVKSLLLPVKGLVAPLTNHLYFRFGLACFLLVGIVILIALDSRDDPRRLISVGGIIAILFVGLLISKHPGDVQWGQVLSGIGLQLIFGLVILRWPAGSEASFCLSHKVKTFLEFADAGSGFVYGYLSSGFNQTTSTGDVIQLPPLFAFKPMSIIFFFNFVMGFLYHYGILLWVVQKIGWFLEVVIGTTASESMGAASNVFLGMTESMLLCKPFLPHMTKSELHALMTACLATIAGSEMGLLMSFGLSPSYLISASLMAAPASLALGKLIYPETEESKTTANQLTALHVRTANSALDAAARGATESIVMIGTIIANLVAFIAAVACLNAILAWLGALVGVELSFELILGKLFIPFAYITGVDSDEVEDFAVLLGLKTIVNEVVAYQKLVSPEMAHLSARTRAIATHALCSFANIGSVGITLGGISFIMPDRRNDIMKTMWFAFVGGSLCGVLNACVAGALLNH